MSHAENVAIIARNEKIEKLVTEKIALVRQRDEARAALKPFADTLNHIPGMNYRDDVPLSSEWVGAGKLTVGDLRRAHNALKD